MWLSAYTVASSQLYRHSRGVLQLAVHSIRLPNNESQNQVERSFSISTVQRTKSLHVYVNRFMRGGMKEPK